MCKLCDDDVVTLAPEQTTTVRIVDDQPQPLSVLSEEITAQIGDLERHLDTERDLYARHQLCDVMWGLRWARECLLCQIDKTHLWQAQPTARDLLARYPHPDEQPK